MELRSLLCSSTTTAPPLTRFTSLRPNPRLSSLPFPKISTSFPRFSTLNLTAIKCTSKPDSGSSSSFGIPRKGASSVPVENMEAGDAFRGKSGSVSFNGLTHQSVEEGKLMSAPFKEESASLIWVLGPVAFIASLVLPQFVIGSFIDSIANELVAEVVASLSSEVAFYAGLATFLLVTDRVQKPYLQFSSKRWSLITGLKGYLSSSFFTMGFKVMAPVFIVYVTWPTLGPSAAVAVAPFLLGCLAQFLFEISVEARGSSSWPIIPIIFEGYRLYQLTKALHFIERLMYAMKDTKVTPKILEKSGALISMVVTFQIVGVFCLWSLLTYLMRLFPSRPVAERY